MKTLATAFAIASLAFGSEPTASSLASLERGARSLTCVQRQRPDQQPLRFIVRAGDDRVSATTLRRLEDMVQPAVDRLAESFPIGFTAPFAIYLHPDQSTLPAGIPRRADDDTPGFALLEARQIHLLRSAIRPQPPQDLQTVLDHELVHILLHDHVGAPANRWIPRWLHEGVAQVLSGDTYLDAREEDLLFAASADRLLRFTDLRRSFPEKPSQRRKAYAQAYSFVSYLARQLPDGMTTILEVARDCDADSWFAGAYARHTHAALLDRHDAWVNYLVHDSGASFRWLAQNCFSYVMILGFVLLALAGIRRWNRDSKYRSKLTAEDQFAAEPTTEFAESDLAHDQETALTDPPPEDPRP